MYASNEPSRMLLELGYLSETDQESQHTQEKKKKKAQVQKESWVNKRYQFALYIAHNGVFPSKLKIHTVTTKKLHRHNAEKEPVHNNKKNRVDNAKQTKPKNTSLKSDMHTVSL